METKVVLSFANWGYGFLFATMLRRRVMKAKGWAHERAVYLDNIAIRGVAGTRIEPRDDKDFRDAHKGMIQSSALNDGWKAAWDKALAEASSVIVVLTDEWARSRNCAAEFEQIRGASGLVRIAIAAEPVEAQAKANFMGGGWELLSSPKIVNAGDGAFRAADAAEIAAHAGAWTVAEPTIARAIGLV